jgi:hypothetical protein
LIGAGTMLSGRDFDRIEDFVYLYNNLIEQK